MGLGILSPVFQRTVNLTREGSLEIVLTFLFTKMTLEGRSSLGLGISFPENNEPCIPAFQNINKVLLENRVSSNLKPKRLRQVYILLS